MRATTLVAVLLVLGVLGYAQTKKIVYRKQIYANQALSDIRKISPVRHGYQVKDNCIVFPPNPSRKSIDDIIKIIKTHPYTCYWKDGMRVQWRGQFVTPKDQNREEALSDRRRSSPSFAVNRRQNQNRNRILFTMPKDNKAIDLTDLALQNLEAEEQLNKKQDTVRNGRKRRSARRRMKFLKNTLQLDTTKPVEVVNTNVTDTTVTAQTLADKTVARTTAKNSRKTRFPKIGHIVEKNSNNNSRSLSDIIKRPLIREHSANRGDSY
jgi:hypothetical protein